MTDETPTPGKPRRTARPAVAVEPAAESPAEAPVAVAEPEPTPADTSPVAEAEPASVDTGAVAAARSPVPAATPTALVEPTPPVQTIYVQAPVAPRKKGNRAVGSIIAVLSAVVFAVVFAIVIAIVGAARTGDFGFGFLGAATFWVPVVYFAVGFVILVLIVNRAGWWVHAVGSIFVALFVYFATVGTLLLIDGILSHTPSEAGLLFAQALVDPLVIAAALVAREVALWMGFVISARGRRLKAQNLQARSAYDTDLAERRAEYDRARAATAVG